MAESLFERLGGIDGIKQIASDLVDTHLKNPKVATRYEAFDADKLKHGAATFFTAGTGGPNIYAGKDMLATHKHMNINHEEFMAVCDDALTALQMNDIGQREQEEVLFILYSMRNEIVGV
ncbi:MAG: group 1 truncated hemoglobin [Xanthomonadales bacterium]|nr:group 1 truncated hemoglobin [Xanthomonadales bacterium]